MIVRPRETLARLLFAHEGRLWEVLFWMVLVTAAAAPVPVGRALLLARVDAFGGVQVLVTLLAERLAAPLVAAVAGALLLQVVDRARRRGSAGQPLSFDAALDGCAFALVPLLLATAAGVLLSTLEVDVWFLPHRALRVTGKTLAIRLAAAYLWPLALFGVAASVVWRGPADTPRGPEG